MLKKNTILVWCNAKETHKDIFFVILSVFCCVQTICTDLKNDHIITLDIVRPHTKVVIACSVI